MSESDLRVQAAFDRTYIPADCVVDRYIMVSITADARGALEFRSGPLNIALAIDASGSMTGDKLEAAKSAALELADSMTAEDILSVVSFETDVRVRVDGRRLTPANRHEVRRQVQSITARAMTNLSGGWFAAVDCAARVSEVLPEYSARTIILSDGRANQGIRDRDQLALHAAELCERGVTTSAMGIGNGYDEFLLNLISEAGGGRLHDAEFPSEVSGVLLGELAEIQVSAAEGLVITVTGDRDVEIEPLGRSSAVRGKGSVSVPIGALPAGGRRRLVFRVTCPPSADGTVLPFKVSGSYRPIGDHEKGELPETALELLAVGRELNDGQIVNHDVADAAAEAWSTHTVQVATQLNHARKFAEASHYVRSQREAFAHYASKHVPAAMEHLEDFDALIPHVSREISARNKKEMMLQSRLVAESRRDWRGAGKTSWRSRLND